MTGRNLDVTIFISPSAFSFFLLDQSRFDTFVSIKQNSLHSTVPSKAEIDTRKI